MELSHSSFGKLQINEIVLIEQASEHQNMLYKYHIL